MYKDESIETYINDLASRRPAPGGGSAAGLCGALGVALLEMVCNFTTGNEKYKKVEMYILNYLETLRNIRKEFEALIDEDVRVYSVIRSAFKMKDKKIIDNSLMEGYRICLKMCIFSRDCMRMAPDLAEKGNANLITDVGCGAELLNAAFNSGIFNCEINLKGIKDNSFAEKERLVLATLKKEFEVLYKDTISKTQKKLQRTEDRGQRSEDRKQKTEDRDQRTDFSDF